MSDLTLLSGSESEGFFEKRYWNSRISQNVPKWGILKKKGIFLKLVWFVNAENFVKYWIALKEM